MEKIGQGLNTIYRNAVVLFATAIFAVLVIMSIMSTCFITSLEDEITYFCKDNVATNILLLIIFFALLVWLKKWGVWEKVKGKLDDDKTYKRIKWTLLLVVFALSIVWVFMTQFVPGSDQLDVMSSAYKLRHNDFSMMEPGGYLDRWKNQAGLTIIEYLCGSIFGDYNVMGFQLVNCFGLVLLYKKIVDVMEQFGCSRISQVITLSQGIVFFPLIMYTSFVYGNICSIALAAAAFYFELLFLKGQKWQHMVVSAGLIAVAIQVKNNVLIIMIAMIIYAFIMSVKEKQLFIKGLVFIFATGIAFFIFNKLPVVLLEQKTGYYLDQGVSSWSFVTMGLQDEMHAPGWSNGYNYDTYLDSGCITEIQEEVAKAEIASRVALFKENSHYAFEFFSQKIASMWTEPTYQSFWINQIRNHRVDFPKWLDSFMSAKGYSAASKVLGYYQLLVFVGCLLWILLEDKESFNERSFFIVIIIGGFLFHLFWEAKSQYSITYDDAKTEAIMKSQLSDEEYRAGSDVVIDNDGEF
nr:hypothetical protein [Lachnospiraceae bacterium]